MLLAKEPEAEEDSKDDIKEGQEKDGPDTKLMETSPSKFCDCAELNSKSAPLLRSPMVGATEGEKADIDGEPEEEGPPWMTPRTFLVDSKYFLTTCTFPDGHELKMTLGAIWQGFLIMGCLAFVIKLVHFPFNQMLVGHV